MVYLVYIKMVLKQAKRQGQLVYCLSVDFFSCNCFDFVYLIVI